jgi:hypothetical protein
MKVIDSLWFCGTANVGIVKVEPTRGEINYYIGSPSEGGVDEVRDEQWIAYFGSKFPEAAGKLLFGD